MLFPWRIWASGWLLRVIGQVCFFGLVGRLFGGSERVQFMVVGNAAMVAAMAALLGTATTTWERRSGTLPFLIAAPTSHIVVFMSRSLERLFDATVSSSVSFYAAASVFSIPLDFPLVLAIIPLFFLVGMGSYSVAMFFGGVILWAMNARNVVTNILSIGMMALCGVNVPIEYLPGWSRFVSGLFPLTYQLEGIRTFLAAGSLRGTLGPTLIGIAVGCVWLCVAISVFWWFGESGRRSGSIEFEV